MNSHQLVLPAITSSTRLQWGQTIWLHPKETIREIVTLNPRENVRMLVYLSALTSVIDMAFGFQETYLLAAIPIALLIIAPISCTLGFWFRCVLLEIGARLFGGAVDTDEIRAAYAWSQSLHVWRMPISFALTMFSYRFSTGDIPPAQIVLFFVLAAIDIVVSLWAFVVLVACVSEVCEFSSWRGLVSIMLSDPLVVISILLLLIAAILSIGEYVHGWFPILKEYTAVLYGGTVEFVNY